MIAEKQNVAGHLQEKKGLWYMVLSYKDHSGERRKKWLPTGLPVKGNNKREADGMLQQARSNFKIEQPIESIVKSGEEISFADFICNWLDMMKLNIEITTYGGYYGKIHNIIAPYFKDKGITVQALKASDIQDFYTYIMKNNKISANTILRYHANIRKALQYAVETDLIISNPADRVQRPKANKFIGNFYDSAALNDLFAVVKGTKLEFAVIIAAFYGLRRGEVIGLKWSAIDFEAKTISIRHTVTETSFDGKCYIVEKDRAKNKYSLRTLPLMPEVEMMLLRLKKGQNERKALFGKGYEQKYAEYIYVDEQGNRIKPAYVSERFREMIQKHELRHIRYHDLRHSCASLLLKNGVSMKEIQEWLGHSNFSTTANIYAHLDFQSKLSSANAISKSGLTISHLNGENCEMPENSLTVAV